MSHSSQSRRDFLRQSAALSGAALLAPGLEAAPPKRSPSEKLNLGVIGVGNRGAANFAGVKHENIVAICDVDEAMAAHARAEFPHAFYTQDFRRLLDRKDLDAVVVSTPDHTHAIITLTALRRGLPVYCEKPLAHTVDEIRQVRATAQKMKTVTQMGTQIHAGDNYRRVVELVQSGTIGPIARVHVWCSTQPNARKLSAHPVPVPSTLAYDLWLGPVTPRPYDPAFLPFHWRWFFHFAGGVLADMACHYIDLPTWALGLTAPTRVAAVGRRLERHSDTDVPDVMRVDYDYPARGSAPPVKLTWYHGVRGPDLDGKRTFKGYSSGVLFEGEKGQIIADYNKHALLPEEKFKGFVPPTPTIPRSIGHHREWLQAVRTGGPTTCNFHYSGLLAESVLLGNVAFRAGEPIAWDSATGKASGSPRAEQFLTCEYRKGWSLDG